MLVWSRYSNVSRVGFYLIAVCSMPVALGGILGTVLGLGGFSKGLADRFAYTVGNTVSMRKPILSPLSIVYIDAALYDIW